MIEAAVDGADEAGTTQVGGVGNEACYDVHDTLGIEHVVHFGVTQAAAA